MHLQTGQTVLLLDAQQRRLGQVLVERADGDLLTGTFQPGPDYPAVERLFHDFEEAVNSQALAVVDALDAAIAALGLCLALPDEPRPLTVQDVQIWSDGGFSCRPGIRAEGAGNGSQEVTQPRQIAGK